MNIFQLSVKSEIPLAKLRRLEKLGALKLDSGGDDFTERLIFHMRGNPLLSVAQLLALIESPDLLDELEAARPKYASRARSQIVALGDIKQAQAPREVTAAIMGASRGDDDESLIIAQWLIAVLPVDPVPHAWAAVRLFAPLNSFMRDQMAPLIGLALMNVRKLPEFSGYWVSEKTGSRAAIKYFQKAKITLDL